MHCSFFWVPYSLKNVMTKIFIFFYQLARPVGNQISQFVGFFKGSMILV